MKKIVVYSGNNCGNCKLAKEYLNANGHSFEEKNVTDNVSFRKELMAKGFMSVPVISVDGVNIVGFDKEKLDSILK